MKKSVLIISIVVSVNCCNISNTTYRNKLVTLPAQPDIVIACQGATTTIPIAETPCSGACVPLDIGPGFVRMV